MATLTQTSFFSKKLFSSFMMLVAAVILFFIFLKIVTFVKDAFWPPSFPPSVAFGKLSRLDISEGIKPPPNVSYSIDTVSGDLPKLPSSAMVFTTAQIQPSFGDLERAQRKAEEAGFTNKPIYDNPPIAKFIDPKNPNKMLLLNTASNTFTLQSDYATNIDVLSAKLTSLDNSKEQANTFFNLFGLSTAEFPAGKTEILTYKTEGSKLVKTPALAGSNLVQVSYYRTEIDKIPVYYPKAVNPEVWVLVSGKNVVYAKSYIWPLEKNRFATYPLKGVKAALEDLKSGNGVYNKLLSDDDPTAPIPQTGFHIFDVTLGYLITEKLQPYLEPIYVFRGDKGQNAYVPAVDNNWIENTVNTN